MKLKSETQILIVDDEPEVIREVIGFLKELGLHRNVITANNGQVGVELAAEYHPDLILTDWQMPKMTGVELVEQLKSQEETRDIPIIMISAVKTDPENLSESFKLGIHDFLPKPFNELEFNARISNVLRLSRTEKALRKNQIRLEELLESKSRFFANVSHDLKTPIALVMGQADLLQLDYERDLPDDILKKIKAIYDQGDRLNKLSNEIRNLIQLDEGQLKINATPTPVNDYLKVLVQVFEAEAEKKGVKIQVKSDLKDGQLVRIDSWQFEKALINLISNSLEFSETEMEISIECSVNNDVLHLEIRDQGPGIEASKIDTIFNRFNSEKPAQRQGLGLGLAIAKEIIELHGGTLRAESQVGHGAAFIIDVPVGIMEDENIENEIGEMPLDEQWVEEESIPTLEEKPSVLIVDDSPELRSFMAECLDTDYRVHLATNGLTAMEKLKQFNIDLIILDIVMPVMDGKEFLEEIKGSRHETIPCLVITSRVDQQDLLAILEKGINNVLPKPFNIQELKLRVKNLLEKKTDDTVMDLINHYDPEAVQKQMIENLEKLIVNNISNQSFSIAVMADEINMSQRKLFNFTKEALGLTPLEFIKKIRFQHAKRLIDQNRVGSLTEAAKSISMSNVTEFKKQYKDHFGTEPTFKK